ncbi:MAG: lactonase family protein [Proteobacteria bacterium]|nr:lactonase family protein [Pseudomonadota bacterium]
MSQVAYVSCAGSGDIWVIAFDPDGRRLTVRQRVAVGGMLMPMALHPAQGVLYVARRSDPLAVAAFAIDPLSGHLTARGESPLPHSMAYLATDRGGHFLFSASYGGNLVAVSPIGADGVPGPAQQIVETGPHAHCVQAAPGNRDVHATSLGGGELMHWRFDATTGRLTPADPPALALHAGAGPRHFVFDAAGRFAYLLGELDASVTQLRYDAAQGTFDVVGTTSSLPAGFDGEPWAADLHLTPDGRFLYTCERRSSTLAIFAIDPVSGAPRLQGHVPTETQPRGFAIDGEGRFLLAAGQRSNRVTAYAIDRTTGALTPQGTLPVGDDPNWVEFVTLKDRNAP